ncbi:MAG: hypothetical protein UMR38_07145 [Candidatus Izemoplasma sp.]|nr:hypothetical protein [Candidatus Izemoplasma sp.]
MISRWLLQFYNSISRKHFFIILGIFTLFILFILPAVSDIKMLLVGVSNSPDTNFNFYLDDFYNMLEQYGHKGRQFYILMRWTFDLIWPLVYTIFIVASIALLSKLTEINYKTNHYILPIMAILFDYFENILATIIMAIYPMTYNWLVYMLFVVSVLKWLTLSLAFIVMFYFVVQFIHSLIAQFKEHNNHKA